jgi:hypothetical protein
VSFTKTPWFVSLLLLGCAALVACELRSQESASLHAERNFVIHVDTPFDQTVPLFGPVGEREWALDWSPRMIFPADGSFPAKGSVFTTAGKHGDEIWILSGYDAQNGFVSYLVVLPGYLVTEIEIHVQKQGENKSSAEVTYRKTALSTEGHHMVAAFSENVDSHAAHWERAINEALRKRRENAGH